MSDWTTALITMNPDPATPRARPKGIAALSLFFIFATTMSGLAALMLLWPDGALDPLWQLNPRAREGFVSMGLWAPVLMAIVSVGCAMAAVGLWRCKVWGYWTAVVILSIDLIGAVANAVVARDWRALIGLPIGGAMIAYLVSKSPLFHP